MGLFDGIGEFLSGGLLSPLGGTSSPMDIADPANLFHEGKAQRLANQQWQLEYDLSKQNFKYQKELSALGMEREDNAVQRRVADLKAAGLSPTLAAGSAASATVAHAGNAPQQLAPSDVKARAAMFREEQTKDRMALAMNMLGNMANVSRTSAETQLLNAQKEGQDIQNMYMSDELSARIEGIILDNQRKALENNVQSSIAPMRVQKFGNELRQQDIDYALSLYDSDLREVQILCENAKLVQQEIENKYREEGIKLDLKEKELKTISLGIAIDQASVDLEATKRDNENYRKMFPDEPRNVADKLAGTYAFSLPYVLGEGASSWGKWIANGAGYVARKAKSAFGFLGRLVAPRH